MVFFKILFSDPIKLAYGDRDNCKVTWHNCSKSADATPSLETSRLFYVDTTTACLHNRASSVFRVVTIVDLSLWAIAVRRMCAGGATALRVEATVGFPAVVMNGCVFCGAWHQEVIFGI